MTVQNDLRRVLQVAQQGRHKKTLAEAKAAMRQHNRHPAFPNFAAVALCAMGRERDAVPYFQKALKLDPEFHDAAKNLAHALIVLHQPEPAAKLLKRVAAACPQDSGVFRILTLAQMDSGKLDDALAAATDYLRLCPKDAQAFMMRADVHAKQNNLASAVTDLDGAAALAPDNFQIWVQKSAVLARMAEHEEATAAARHAVDLAPQHPRVLTNYATQLVNAGELEQAAEVYRRILEIQPGEPDVLEHLARLQSREENEGIWPVALAEYDKAPKGPGRAALGFALAHMAEQRGDRQAANTYLNAANREIAKITPYPAAEEKRFNDKILNRFRSPLSFDRRTRAQHPRPIFIVGLPRSGTTLTETILGASPEVAPLGERPTCDLLYPIIQEDLPFGPDEVESLVAADQAQLPEHARSARAYTDKMPENHRLIGFLVAAYPDCRIVDLRRDPRDVALSMWRGRFSNGALSYSYDLQSMAHRFNLYAEIMAHWHNLYPGSIYRLSYEDLVADVTSASRSLAEFCGIEWVENMARPELYTGGVRTMTAHQLRQPVHMRSVGKWRDYEDVMAPFVTALDKKLWQELEPDN
ncbi:tetratricopeptide repeat protein [Ruegeria sediminis]|uniref:Tetratricopeptide repeat protein n=1 Tax=Ruegeria sediminis TaxID=2583820 RepID=A0ABY2WV26_9RHOB|nr:tetratricopeptide repeat-containing sulfotransferase family protein [Ruegeria sediminis]TMV06438.1 tetratricopeptide repeat protein [Ruegeria sediminis]